MLVRMSKMTDMPGNPKQNKTKHKYKKHRQGKIRTLQTERPFTFLYIAIYELL